jgi:hypothetical protein
MKKTDKVEDLKAEYARKELGNGTRGKYFKSYNESNNLVLLRPELSFSNFLSRTANLS